MSDFDDVLERMLTDPAFKAALAADPASTLAGYRLSDDERQLLSAQVSADAGGQTAVEQRTSKASMFGLLSSISDAAGGFGHGGQPAAAGSAPPPYGGQTGPRAADASIGYALSDGQTGPGTTGASIGHALSDAAPAHAPSAPVPDLGGYDTSVDADGDGTWDAHTLQARADGSVDIIVDQDGDGRADFVAHDYNRDGIVDAAEYDNDGDGRLETHMTDTNGDGWLDHSTVVEQPAADQSGMPQVGDALNAPRTAGPPVQPTLRASGDEPAS